MATTVKSCKNDNFYISLEMQHRYENDIYVVTEKSCELYHLVFSKNTGFSFVKSVLILPSSSNTSVQLTYKIGIPFAPFLI